jgi:LPS-assembly lipoprotein
LSRLAAAVVLLLALAGCGFQLRGDAGAGLRSVHVSAEKPSVVAVELRRQLASGPTRLVAQSKEAETHIRILEESTEKTIQTLTGAGRVYDYLLRLRVRFSATAAAGKEVVAPAEFELRRLITYSETAPLAKEAEERLLFEDMRAEAAARILRRVAVAAGMSSP